MKILLGIQARSLSRRLPGKIYEKIGPKSVIEWVYDSAKEAAYQLNEKGIQANVAILGQHKDWQLSSFCTDRLIRFEGPDVKDDDLLSRYLVVAQALRVTHILRITADCWLHSSAIMLDAANALKTVDYVCNTSFRTFPEGYDIQGCSLSALKWFDKNQKEEREHPFLSFDVNDIVRKQFEKAGFKYNQIMNPDLAFLIKGTSIDTKEDLERARRMYEEQNARKRVERTPNKYHGAGPNGNVEQRLESVRRGDLSKPL